MKTKILMLGMIFSIMTISCSKNESQNQDNTTITADEAIINSKIDVATDDVANVIEQEVELTQSSRTLNPELNPPSGCPTITRIPAFYITTTTPPTAIIPEIGSTVSKNIDFGTGCRIANGNVLRGIINISFIYDPSATTRVVTYTFNNFFHNLRQINGTKTFTKTTTLTGATVVMQMDLTMTLADGRTLRRIGTRTRTIIAGFNTPLIFNDNVYQVTGNWTTTYPNNSIQTSTITTPLEIKIACTPLNSPISKGIITFVRNGRTATLDYGNGTCDKLAVFTNNGIAFNITLGGVN